MDDEREEAFRDRTVDGGNHQRRLEVFILVNRVVALSAGLLMFALFPGSRFIVVALLVLFAVDTFFMVKRLRRIRSENDRGD